MDKIKIKNILLLMFFVLTFGYVYPQNPKDNQLQTDYELAKQYMQQEQFSEAAALLEGIIDKQFRDEYYRLLISAYNELKDAKKQEKLIKKAVKKNADNYRYAIDLGNFYINNNDKAKGEKQYESVLKKLTADNSKIVQTANYFTSLRNYEWAAKTYIRGRELLKDDTKYTYEITYIYQLLGDNEGIAREYLILLDKNPLALNQIEVNINNLFNRDKDAKLYETISQTVLERVKKQPDNVQYSLLYYWLLMQKKDYPSAFIQAKAINKRFKQQNFETLIDFARNTQNAGQYKYSLEAYDYILKQKPEEELAFSVSQDRLTCLYNQFIQKIHPTDKEINALDKEYEQVFALQGYTAKTAAIMQQYADILAYRLQKPQQAVDLLDSIINMKQVDNRMKAQCKLTRADIYLINGDIWEASLTYSQVDKDFKNEVIGFEAKFRNAMLSYYTGDFDWALSQFDALRSSTTKLIANDAMEYSLLIKENMDDDSTYKGLAWFSKADFCLYQNKVQEAKTYLDSIDNWYVTHPLFDEILYKRAEIAIKEEQFKQAEQYLEDIIMKYPYDLTADDAIMLLAGLSEEQFKDKDKAKQYYEKIILDYPSSLYIQQARKRYNEL
ncbi:MAG: tetratricopeptide repeat protein [Bacteroidales bacterium]|nr:tetratricopeptide repeat protein [Bacteroidales bacterium]